MKKPDNMKKAPPIKVLLVDDEREVTELWTYAMRKEPYLIKTAASVQEAMDIFRQEPADILVTDIKMPGMSGLELAGMIIKDFPATQIVVVTAHGDVDTAVKAMKLGATDFLQKPVHNRTLRLSIESAAEKWHLRKELQIASRALREEKELLAVTMRSVGEGVITTDTMQKVTMINEMAEKFMGWSANEAYGLPIRDIFKIHNDTGNGNILEDMMQKVLETGNPEEVLTPLVLHSRHDKDFLNISLNITPLRNSDNHIRGTVMVFRDITARLKKEKKAREAEQEKRRMEAVIHRAQKMEAIGMMAGGVAHDLNNILSGILSYPELILLDIPHDSPLRKPLKIIQEAGQRAADVVADLLTVARGAAAVKQLTQLNSIIIKYLNAPELKYPCSARPGITIITELEDDLLHIECSPVHIRKCILNLVLNAMEAVDHSGTITISTENRYIDTPVRGYDHVIRGEYVILSVKDTGEGITPQDLEHIFEPFYTKKIMGRSGTGLGLAVVWNTVQDHNGYIDVISSTDGTCFEIYFPASRDVPEQVREAESIDISRGRGETVLIVDDEYYQRDIACTILKRLGYDVHAVASGEDAIEFIKESPVDLLLLDMIMNPGMSGRQTYEHIIRMYPGQRAVIASGFSETEDVKQIQRLGAGQFIKKPYTMSLLGRAVAKELGRR